MKTTFIGGGNMGNALIGGMVARGAQASDFRVVEPLPDARARLVARHPGISVLDVCGPEATVGADLIVLAVKPQHMRVAATTLHPLLSCPSLPVVLSIAAGIRIENLTRWLGGHARIVRAMPNTPALIGKGISGAFAASAVDADGRALAAAVLEAVGELVWVDDEAMLDAVTGVSGSGPAYVFYFLEALEAAALELGFRREDARRLAYATFDGAIALARSSADEPRSLRAQVTSKGGTTERAIATLEADAVKARIVAAVRAAAERARELGDQAGA